LPLKRSPFRTASGSTVITSAPITRNKASFVLTLDCRAPSEQGDAMTASEYAIVAVLIGVPVMIVWFALSKREF
jgi:hypothetical protein